MKREEDHPHIHGEYHFPPVIGVALQGSPPHTWGIRTARADATAGVGITPTYMGNTHLFMTISWLF